MDTIRNIDSIKLSDRTIKSRAEKIIRAYYRLQGEPHHQPMPPSSHSSTGYPWHPSLPLAYHESIPPSPYKTGPITEHVTVSSSRRTSYATHTPADAGSVTPSSHMHQRPTTRQKPDEATSHRQSIGRRVTQPSFQKKPDEVTSLKQSTGRRVTQASFPKKLDKATSHKQSGSRRMTQPPFQTRAAESIYREQFVGRHEFQSPAEKVSIVSTSNIPSKRKLIKTASWSPHRLSKRARSAPGSYTVEHLSVGSEDSDFHSHDFPEMITNSSDDENDNDDAAEDAHGLSSPCPRPGAYTGRDIQKHVAVTDEDAIHEYVSDPDNEPESHPIT
ncbi:hypothetical protein KCU65_g2038, partial [Aureobasidium melanogenum]